MDISVPLGKLQKGREKRGIAVRVVRKWFVKDNNGQGPPLYIGLVLADANADAIYGEIPKDIIDTKSYLLEVGTAYVIKKFRVNSSKSYYKPVDGTLMIELTAFTTIELIVNPPASMPVYIYSVTPFPAVVPTNGAVFRYTDVVGYITRYTPVSKFVPKNKEKLTILREVYLKDLRDNEMKVTLWGDHATDFSVEPVYDKNVGNVIVCLIVGCIPRKVYNDPNKTYLNGSPACAYYLNPNIPEAAPFYSRFKDTPIYMDCPAETGPRSALEAVDIPLEQKTISELDQIDPFDFEDSKYKCMITIISIPSNYSWWYRSCVACKKKAEQQPDHRYRCPKCLGYDIIPRYLLSFVGEDHTGQANFFAYDEEAKLIIQKDCDALINPLTMSSGLPQPLQRIIGKTYTFAINLTDDSCKGPLNRQYLVKSVLQRPSRQNASSDIIDTQMDDGQTQVLQIEAGTQSTPAPAPESDHDIGKYSTTRLESKARKKLSLESDVAAQPSSKNIGAQQIHQVVHDAADTEPGSKRAKITPPGSSAKSASQPLPPRFLCKTTRPPYVPRLVRAAQLRYVIT